MDLSHLHSDHSSFGRLLDQDRSIARSPVHNLMQQNNVHQLFEWYDTVINALLPYSTVEKEAVRQKVDRKPISIDAFMKYTPTFTAKIVIKHFILPKLFALVIDSRSEETAQYVGIFSIFLET